MTAAELLSAFEGADRDLLAKQREIESARKTARFLVESDLLSILRARTGDPAWQVWGGGNRPRFMHNDGRYITFSGRYVVLRTRHGKTRYHSLEDAADAIKGTP